MNCILYARVSTDKQADKDFSIPAQLQAMRDYAHQHGWVVVGEFIEPGVSAKTVERPSLQRMLTMVRDRDAKVEVVLVHKIDRLARNVADHATIRALFKQLGIKLASVVENVDDTVSGQLVENIMASIAQFYSANLGEEVKKGMRQKVLRGGWPHLPPCGYVQVRLEDGRGSRVEVQPRIGPIITQAFDLYATGHYSLRRLAERMAREGLTSRSGTPLVQSQLLRILTNPFYTGRLRWKGQDLPGEHQALTTSPTFEQVQQVVRRRYRHVGVKGTVTGFPLRAVGICASCRGRMTAERHERWGYYRCSRQSYKKERCVARFCNAKRAHDDLDRTLATIQITRPTAVAIRKAAKHLLAARTANSHTRLEQLRARQQQLLESEMQLADAFAANDIAPANYNLQAETIRSQKSELLIGISAASVSPDDVMKRIDGTLGLATSMLDVYKSFSDGKRAELIQIVFKTIVLGPAGVVGFSLRPPFEALICRGTAAQDATRSADALLNAAAAA